MQSNNSDESLALNPTAMEQIHACLDLVKEIFGRNLLGVYLYGSAISCGLQKYSDIEMTEPMLSENMNRSILLIDK